MKATILLPLALALGLTSSHPASAFEVLAIGTSATNCKGVDRDKIYPVKLQEILRRDGLDATVINAGVDGDLPMWTFNRLPAAITADTKLVLFQPGPARQKAEARAYVEKALVFLHDRNMPAIYMSTPQIHSAEKAAAMAAKYGVYYYGPFAKVVPKDSKYWLGDNEREFGGSGAGFGGHMSAAGCALVAQDVAPLVEKALAEKAGIVAARR